MSYQDENDIFNFDKKDVKTVKKIIYWIIALSLVLSGIGWFMNRSVSVVDSGILHYEEYQEIYHTCQKLNTDLCNMQTMPETDPMFAQFSKAQRILTIKTQLNRWVEDYNAKSKMINRSLWKSKELPYQLQLTEFNCY